MDCSTLPAVIAYTQLFPSEVAVAMVWAATVVPAVRYVTRFSLPVFITLTVHSARYGVRGGALAMARAVIRA